MPGIYAPDGSMNVTLATDSVNPTNNPNGTSNRTSSGATRPPTAAVGKIVETVVSLPANASTQIIGANPNRIVLEIQTDGAATVGLSRTGNALVSVAAAGLVVPSGSFPLYTMPISTLSAVTAYTTVAQTVRVTEYLA